MITVDDGEIVGIGGLLDDNERRTIEKIPFLGDLPAIGNLFKSKSRSRAKTNLMVFIRPTILRSAADARAMTERRYGYIRGMQYQQNPERGADASTSWSANIWAWSRPIRRPRRRRRSIRRLYAPRDPAGRPGGDSAPRRRRRGLRGDATVAATTDLGDGPMPAAGCRLEPALSLRQAERDRPGRRGGRPGSGGASRRAPIRAR